MQSYNNILLPGIVELQHSTTLPELGTGLMFSSNIAKYLFYSEISNSSTVKVYVVIGTIM